MRIVRLSDNATLAERAISVNAPVVSNVALQSASDPVTGTVTLSWAASDADSDPLTFEVHYSNDGGATWAPVVSGLADTSAAIDTSPLGGGTGRFRVIASDGANTGQADSPPFTMADKPPIPLILTPADGLRIQYGQLVNFSGAALDWQDGGVTGDDLVWSSDLDGVLGMGEQISTQSLRVGTHTITLRATNSRGSSASASITVVVHDDLSLPGPTLTASPLSFAWDFPADATASSSQVLHIGNAGDGTLNWTASTDAAWLILSTTSGAAPTDLTLTANPSGVLNGSVLAGTLTLTVPAAGDVLTQTLRIPVGLRKGFDPTNPPGYRQPGLLSNRLFVPLVAR